MLHHSVSTEDSILPQTVYMLEIFWFLPIWFIGNEGDTKLSHWYALTTNTNLVVHCPNHIQCYIQIYDVNILQVGGATAKIGDPSGRTTERDPLATKFVDDNVAGLYKNIKTIFDNHKKYFWNSENKKLLPIK